ncbi:uncharacterized protein C8A04DRAFT_8858 [Dichotomopilus funicola]|uniref:Uncharacterized protein n=1 Tax=Dichotomopilus funicola TaxID=1934379 RepID=A0AAN6VAH0_9PEZI|nr:hypothetical protein C8A04DRAFT_8858 [Dichotomopilus funicola]
MAPLASEPRQVLTVLNLARRKALYTLLVEITAFMRSQLEAARELSSGSPGGDAAALLQIDPSAENSIVIPATTEAGDATPASPALVRLRAAALDDLDVWRKDLLATLRELLSTPDDVAILDARRKRTDRIAQQQQQQQRQKQQQGTTTLQSPNRGSSSAGNAAGLFSAARFDGGPESEGQPGRDRDEEEEDPREAVARLQSHWHPIPTRLTTISEEDRREALSCVLLVLLATGRYSAHSRALAVYLTSALELPLAILDTEEAEIAVSLVERSAEAEKQQQPGQQRRTTGMSAEAEAAKRKQQNQQSRYWKVGLASVAGAALIGVTGGLAAPVVAGAIGGIMGSVGLGGVASFLGIFWMNGALVGTLFGAFGARMTGEMVDQYAKEVDNFRFIPLKDEWGTRPASQNDRRLRVTIGINGWLNTKDDVTRPWRALADDSEAFALQYEIKSLLGLGKSLRELVSSYAWNTVKMEILKRTVLATLWSALWPAYLLSMASTIDNPFNLAKNRSEKAGEILADALINKVQGERPVTLIGYSLGARVIYSCLRSLAARKAFGLIDSVVFIGAPVPSNRQHWQMIRTVVSGKLFNVYTENDYLLAFLYRATSVQLGVAGLQAIRDIEGVENLDLSEEVQGHMRYDKLIGKILARCGVPVVRGADGQIEQDESVIQLSDDLDKNDANLIELDSLDLGEAPPKKTQSVPSSASAPILPPRPSAPQQDRKRTVVSRVASSSVPASQDLLGLDLSETPTPITKRPEPPVSTTPSGRPASSISAPIVPTGSRIDAPTKPELTSSHHQSAVSHAHDESDESDEESGMGITMVDNDGDLEYCDPTPLDDRDWR